MNQSTNNPFHDAIINNDIDSLKKLKEDGFDLHYDNDRPFLAACYYGNIEIIEYLLSQGADINAYSTSYEFSYPFSGTGLSLAINNKQWEVFDYLLEKGIKVDTNHSQALGVALFSNEFSRAKLLIEKGAEINETNVLIEAATKEKWDLVKFIVEETNVNIHERDDFALRYACDQGHFETVKLLVEKGANINAIPAYEDGRNNNYAFNDVALMYAIFSDNWEIFNYLIENGADPNLNNQDTFIQSYLLRGDYYYLKNFMDHYIEKEYVVFNKTIFEKLVVDNDLDLIKFFLNNYSKKDIDEVHILDNKAIYNFDKTDIFEYFLSNGYEVSEKTRNMLVEERKDKFLQILLNHDLNKELGVSEKISKKLKI